MTRNAKIHSQQQSWHHWMGHRDEPVDCRCPSLAPWGRGTDFEAPAKNQGEGTAQPQQATRQWAILLTFIGCLTLLPTARSVGDTTSPLFTGVRLRSELQRPINITRPDVPLREIIARLSELHHIAILLDRRIDPDQRIDVQLSQVTLNDGLELLARQVDADAGIVGSTIIIGPGDALDRTRTDIVIQVLSLSRSSIIAQQRFNRNVYSSKTIQWDDLQSPSDLVQMIVEEFAFTVPDSTLMFDEFDSSREQLKTIPVRRDLILSGIDRIPHDLWAAGVMADVTVVEALTLVAAQYDLTCNWNLEATSVRLAPARGRQTIEKRYTVSPQRYKAVKLQLQEEAPLANIVSMGPGFTPQGRYMMFAATVGEHERIKAILTGDPDKQQDDTPDQGPLQNRTFTLTTERASVIAILRTLESQGTNVEYDADALVAVGIDLSQKVTLSLNKATADEFFQALCEPLGLDYEIDGKTVRLTPKP